MLTPRKVKHRKWHKGRSRNKGVASQRRAVSFGSFGLLATTHAWVTARQIEAARRVITREMKRGGKVWIRIFPDKPITSKGSEVPMGGGKGAVDHYVAIVKPGTMLFEVDGNTTEILTKALSQAAYKLPVQTKVLAREHA